MYEKGKVLRILIRTEQISCKTGSVVQCDREKVKRIRLNVNSGITVVTMCKSPRSTLIGFIMRCYKGKDEEMRYFDIFHMWELRQ